MPYEPIHHKYRPQTFKDLVGQETIALTLNNALQQEKIAPAYLFTGPRGTGKTSSARILAKSLNCLAAAKPTPNPCGKCEACQAIANGSALDVMEIDAASNTGVDNIREIIERSRFAPVQCRYKIYAIDECLTGDSLIQTDTGFMRIDDPNLKGQKVLSYNERVKVWEYKKVLRWLERGTKPTLIIQTGDRRIRCTENHLIRTEAGWIEAKNVKEGMKILSPVNADAEISSINTVQTEEFVDSLKDISSKETNTAANPINSQKLSSKQKRYSLSVSADVKKNSIFPIFYKKREEELKVFNPIGIDIPIEKVMEFGIEEVKILLNRLKNYTPNNWDLFTELYWVMEALNIQIPTVDSLVCAGLMETSSSNGWNIKQIDYNNYVREYVTLSIKDTAIDRQSVTQPVILSYNKSTKSSNPKVNINLFQWNGLNSLLQKDWLGGTWMMALFNLAQKVAQPLFFILKDFLKRKIKLFPFGLQTLDILLAQDRILENLQKKPIITSNLQENQAANGYQIYDRIQSHRWNTNLEEVKSIAVGDDEAVYDLEVEDNHNFVANGLLVHNCHMLSTAAFNALLKTLEEPPPQVVFILATTDPQRVLSTIISRCQRFDYRRIPLPDMVGHLRYIAGEEKIAIADDALTLVAQIANGGLRDAESLLDQLSLLPDTITVEKVWDLVGAVPEQDLLKLLHFINSNNSLGVLEQCRNLLDRGREPIVVLQNLAGFYLNLLIAKTAPQRPDMVAVTETCWQQLCQAATNWDASSILQGQQQLKEAETQLKRTTQPRLWLEVTLLGLLPQAHQTAVVIQPQQVTVTRTNSHSPVEASKPVGTFRETSLHEVKPTGTSLVESQSDRLENKIEAEDRAIISSTPPRAKIESQEISPVQDITKKTVEHPFASVAPLPEIPKPEPLPQEVIPLTTNNFDLEKIWSQVINAIPSRMTQELLKQQCHLMDFEGSIAIVGISSATLQKLNQNKVPIIEKAFAKVIGNNVRVQLEVATANSNTRSAKSNSSQVNSTINPIQEKPPDIPQSKHFVESAKPETSVTKEGSDRVVSPIDPTPTTKIATPPVVNPEPVAIAPTVRPIQPVSEPEPPLSTSHIEADLASDAEEELIEKAIANLTLAFEGELVEMNDLGKESSDVMPENQTDAIAKNSHSGRQNIKEDEYDW